MASVVLRRGGCRPCAAPPSGRPGRAGRGRARRLGRVLLCRRLAGGRLVRRASVVRGSASPRQGSARCGLAAVCVVCVGCVFVVGVRDRLGGAPRHPPHRRPRRRSRDGSRPHGGRRRGRPGRPRGCGPRPVHAPAGVPGGPRRPGLGALGLEHACAPPRPRPRVPAAPPAALRSAGRGRSLAARRLVRRCSVFRLRPIEATSPIRARTTTTMTMIQMRVPVSMGLPPGGRRSNVGPPGRAVFTCKGARLGSETVGGRSTCRGPGVATRPDRATRVRASTYGPAAAVRRRLECTCVPGGTHVPSSSSRRRRRRPPDGPDHVAPRRLGPGGAPPSLVGGAGLGAHSVLTVYGSDPAARSTPIPVGVLYLGFVSLAMHDAAQASSRRAWSSETAAVAAAAHPC